MSFSILGTPRPQFLDDSGSPIVGGTLSVIEPTDDTNKASYPTATDADAATNANDNPMTLNSFGMPPTGLFGVDGESYKIIVKASDGSTVIWSHDDIKLPGNAPPHYDATTDEDAVSVVPSDLSYPVGDSRRYGALFDGTTDDSSAHQDALDVLAEMGGGTWIISDGTSKAQGLIVAANHIHIDCRGILVPVSNTSADSVVQFGAGNDDIRGITGNLNVGGLSQVFENWTNITGIDARDLQESQLHVNVRGFGVGMGFTPDTNSFVAYNNFFIGGMVNNKVDMLFDPSSSGACNENKFWGGRFAENSSTWVSGRTIIKINDDGNHQVNGNVWISPSFESAGRLWDSVGALDNHVLLARYEPLISGTADADYDSVQVLMDSTSQRNRLDFSGGDSWFTNSVDHGAGTRVDDASFTIAGTDATPWFYVGAPILMTVSGTDVFAFAQSSSFSTDTTVVVSLPVVTANPTAIETARFKVSGDDNSISANAIGITGVDTFNVVSRPRSLMSFERSSIHLSAINLTYPALTGGPGSSDSEIFFKLTNLAGVTSSFLTVGGEQYVKEFSVGDITTPIASRTHVANPTGGSTTDAEARTAINSILATLEAFGLHKAS